MSIPFTAEVRDFKSATSAPERGVPLVGAVQHFQQDQELFAQGDSADYFYRVVSGAVRTCKFLVDGRRQIDAFYVAGDIFGLEAGTTYRLSAEAVTDCVIIACRKAKADILAGGEKLFVRDVLAFAMDGMARAQDHALLLGRRSAVEKVAGFLVGWIGKGGAEDAVTLAMSRLDIADYLGLTIETVSRTLSQLEREGVIALLSARNIRLCDPARLKALYA